jgi:hypothetical protein
MGSLSVYMPFTSSSLIVSNFALCVQFSLKFHDTHQAFAHTSETGKTQTPTLFLRRQEKQGIRVSPIFVPVHQVVKVLIGRHPRSVFKQVEIVVLLHKHGV